MANPFRVFSFVKKNMSWFGFVPSWQNSRPIFDRFCVHPIGGSAHPNIQQHPSAFLGCTSFGGPGQSGRYHGDRGRGHRGGHRLSPETGHSNGHFQQCLFFVFFEVPLFWQEGKTMESDSEVELHDLYPEVWNPERL